MIDVGKLLGRGIGFAPMVGEDGRVQWSAGIDNIKESIRIILLTERGERLMMPDFGAGLKRYLYKPNTVTTHRRIEEEIMQSLDQWEPRIEVDSVVVKEDKSDPQLAHVVISYALITNQRQDQITFQLRLAG